MMREVLLGGNGPGCYVDFRAVTLCAFGGHRNIVFGGADFDVDLAFYRTQPFVEKINGNRKRQRAKNQCTAERRNLHFPKWGFVIVADDFETLDANIGSGRVNGAAEGAIKFSFFHFHSPF